MLKGNLVGLRAIEKTDLTQLLQWRNNPEFRRFFESIVN
ncbi:GNAT family N-acetyltransferase OS=Lysinibacillus sphaericus OX=1421 GN=LS41612_19540 PE=4 SV=1 [Lysinibacillus sphaericus]